MSEFEDKEISGKATGGLVSTISDPITDGLDAVDITLEQLESYGDFLNDLYEKIRKKHGKDVTRNPHTMLKGALFAIGTEKQNNPEWREHCASSLREIFHEWNGGDVSSDFALFFRNKKPLSQEEKDAARELKTLYEYFTGIDHHNASTTMQSSIYLKKDRSLKWGDCVEKDFFIDMVKMLFTAIARIIALSTKVQV